MPTFSIRTFSCDECNETFYVHKDRGVDKIQTEHIETHRLGRCPECRHWNTTHHATDEAMREYLKTDQKVCCAYPLGMGDFCGCGHDGE